MISRFGPGRGEEARWKVLGARAGSQRGTLAVVCLLTALTAVEPTPAATQASGGFEVMEATIPELQAALASGRTTSVALVDAYLARIAAYDQRGPALNAIVRVNADARAEAARLDRERAERGPRGPLHGIPIILKDNFDAVGLPTSGGSIALAGLMPPDDAYQVRRLREAGAIVLAKSNLHELAAGITSISSFGGQTRNPYDPRRNAGGSSGGTGAAVAASFGAVGWGSDTCGSIRIPAALNNLFGLRPTKGLSSIDGILPLSHSQDVGGPLARTARDLAIALDATVGPDPADPATRILAGRALLRFVDALDEGALTGARIGVLSAHFGASSEDREIGRVVRAALDTLKIRGARVVEVEVPRLDSLLEGTSLIGHEFKWDLIDYLAATPDAPVDSLGDILARGLYHAELEERFRERNRTPSRETREYRDALAKRERARAVVLAAMQRAGVEALAYPTMRRKAALVGEPAPGANCQLSAATGFPALSIPAGFTEDGLPVGLELLGTPLSDARLVALGYAFEQTTRFRRPPALTPPLRAGTPPEPVELRATARAAEVVPAAMGAAGAEGVFRYDPLRGTLAYRVRVTDTPAAEVHAVTLQRGSRGEAGAVIHRLVIPAATDGQGTVELSPADRDALLRGALYLQLYTRSAPTGAARGQLLTAGSL